MGRAKLKMQLIEKKKSRVLTFKKRSEGLKKKLHQLTTLCGIRACMIITCPDDQNSGDVVGIWPHENPDEVRRLIEQYKLKSREIGGVKTYGLSDFFEDMRRKTEDEAAKLRKKNSEAKYPSWDPDLNVMSEFQLRGLGDALRAKASAVRSRIQFFKMREKQQQQDFKMLNNHPNLAQFYANPPALVHNIPYLIQPNCGGDFASWEWPITYDAGAPAQLPMTGYHAPPTPHAQPYMQFWPASSSYDAGAEAQLPMIGQHQCYAPPNMNYWGCDDDDLTQYLLHGIDG